MAPPLFLRHWSQPIMKKGAQSGRAFNAITGAPNNLPRLLTCQVCLSLDDSYWAPGPCRWVQGFLTVTHREDRDCSSPEAKHSKTDKNSISYVLFISAFFGLPYTIYLSCIHLPCWCNHVIKSSEGRRHRSHRRVCEIVYSRFTQRHENGGPLFVQFNLQKLFAHSMEANAKPYLNSKGVLQCLSLSNITNLSSNTIRNLYTLSAFRVQ